MYYPANYGFIPNTLSEDRDPCDCMVLSQVPVAPSAVIRCRPIGALLMEDENGVDEKIIAVPVDELNPFYDDIGELTDLPPIFRDQIEHFFRHYKDLERGKWVKLTGWADREKARAHHGSDFALQARLSSAFDSGARPNAGAPRTLA